MDHMSCISSLRCLIYGHCSIQALAAVREGIDPEAPEALKARPGVAHLPSAL